MATTAIIINSTDGFGKSAQKAMTCVNPDATNAELATLGQMITAAQNHTYGNTVRVDKTDCDTEASIPPKPTPTLTAAKTTFSLTSDFSGDGIKESSTFALTYNGDGDLILDRAAILAGLSFRTWKISDNVNIQLFYYTSQAPTAPLTFKVGFTETDNYKAASVEMTLTA